MMRRVLPSLRDAAWHPGDEQLVAFIDAELEVREAARVEDHLTRCWTCRARRQQLQETIGSFMQAYASLAEEEEAADDHEHVPMPRAAEHALRTSLRLRERMPHAAVTTMIHRASRWMSSCAPTRPVAVRLVAAFATALVVFVLSSETQVSAVQLVRHVDAAERTLLDGARGPVVHQRLEVARRLLPGGNAVGGTWDVWTDVDLQRRHSRALGGYAAADDVARALFALFDRQGMRDAWPVSLRSHQQWRAREQARGMRDDVQSGRTSSGEATLTLDTTLAASTSASMEAGIVRATLVVRERDWHPVEQRLLVRQDGATSEFVVREAHFEVVPLASLPVAFFNDSGSTPTDRVADRVTPEPSAVSTVARDVDLVTAEVQAMYALHRVGLTAEDDINVTRRGHQIDVRGVTTTDARRKQLATALANIPFVRVRIRTADEALAALTTPTAKASASAASTASPTPLQFDEAEIQADRLPAPVGTATASATATADAATMTRARTAVTHSLTLLERAWSLRRLAEWVNRTRASHITRTTRDLIDAMAREHAEAATRALAALDTTIAPALPASAPTPAAAADAPPPPAAWPEIATDFFGVAAEIDRDTRRLFTASAAPTVNAAEDAQRLRHGLDEAAQRLKDLQRTRP